MIAGIPIPNVNVSAIPNVQSSAISAFGMGEWLEEVPEVNMGATLLKEQIIESMDQSEEGKVTFKVDLLRNYGKGHELDTVLPDTLKEIYQDERLEYHIVLLLIR